MFTLPTDSLLVAVPMLLIGVALVLWSVERFVNIETPRRYLALTAASPALLLLLGYDGQLSRLDGALLVAAYGAALLLLYRWEQAGAHSYLALEDELEDEDGSGSALAALGVLALATLGMTVGSQLVVEGSKGVLAWLGLSGLAFGATVLSVVASKAAFRERRARPCSPPTLRT